MTKLFIISALLFSGVAPAAFAHHGPVHAASQELQYIRSHSLGETYKFDPRDGWEPVNITNMAYTQPHPNLARTHDLATRWSKKGHGKENSGGVAGAVSGVLDSVVAGLKGIGNPEPVTITWYTGHDLLNPSCWSKTGWAPTDASFACALTLDGWATRPKCFKFLELCHSPKKCVFVRVVDTCAGCAPGSKHVDLTRAAFGALADYDVGSLTVQLRAATEPTHWYENLWGPRN